MKQKTKQQLRDDIEYLKYELHELRNAEPKYRSAWIPGTMICLVLVVISWNMWHAVDNLPEVLLPGEYACESYFKDQHVILCEESGGIPILDYEEKLRDCIFQNG